MRILDSFNGDYFLPTLNVLFLVVQLETEESRGRDNERDLYLYWSVFKYDLDLVVVGVLSLLL